MTLWEQPGVGGDDLWNDGDTFTYLHQNERVSGDFTATVRVVGQTASIDGRWGKGGLMMRNSLEPDSANAMPAVYTGNGSQVTPPSAALGNAKTDYDPVNVRVNGRTAEGNNAGSFEREVKDALGNFVQNNLAPTSAPGTVDAPFNPGWLRIHYRAPDAENANGTIIGAYAHDDGNAPGDWAYSDPITDVEIADDEAWYIGLAYSAHEDMSATEQMSVPGPNGGANPNGLHGMIFDNFDLVPEYLEPVHTLRVNGNSIGALNLDGALSNVQLGPEETVSGLSTWWYDANLRGNVAAEGGFLEISGWAEEDPSAIADGEFGRVTNPVGWHEGDGNTRMIGGIAYPAYPDGTFTGDKNDYKHHLAWPDLGPRKWHLRHHGCNRRLHDDRR